MASPGFNKILPLFKGDRAWRLRRLIRNGVGDLVVYDKDYGTQRLGGCGVVGTANAQVTEAEGSKRAVELAADAELYASEQTAKARRILADAEAYATQMVATAINENGLEAAQYQIALKQVEALNKLGAGEGKQTIVLPAQAIEAFGDAFKLLRGRG